MFKKNKKQTETIKEPKEKKVRTVKVERLILEKGRLPQEDMTDDLKCRESFIKNLKESFR